MVKYLKLASIFFFVFFISTYLAAQYSIGYEYLSFQDPDRDNRVVSGQLYYPANSAGEATDIAIGQFPFIAFGHGFGMSWMEYEIWWETLVPQGYFIFLPDTEASFFPFPSHGDFGADLSFLVNKFMDFNQDENSIYYERLNNHNAIMGHSMGGGCSYLAGDGNENITTIITLAAAETNPSAIVAAANLSIPILTIAGSADCVVMDGGAPIDIHNALEGDAYRAYVNITDASHCQFGIASPNSICLFGELCNDFLPIATQHDYMLQTANPWLDYYLKEDCNAWNTFDDYLKNSANHTYLEGGIPPTVPSDIPSLVLEGSIISLSSDGDFEVQWYRNDLLLEGEMGLSLLVQNNGIYTAELIYTVGCSVYLEPIEINMVANQEINQLFNFDCYPSYATESIHITLETKVKGDFILELINPYGHIMRKERLKVQSQYHNNLDIANLPSGVYFLRVRAINTANIIIDQFIKQH